MSLEWIMTGIILLGGMAAGGISLYVKRKRKKEVDKQNEFHI
jgi:LPXTG-motif cell wall-anchored protein